MYSCSRYNTVYSVYFVFIVLGVLQVVVVVISKEYRHCNFGILRGKADVSDLDDQYLSQIILIDQI